MFWHNRSHVNLYPSGPIHKCYFNMKYPSLYCAWFVESCQTSPSKKEKRNFGIVKSIFVYYFLHATFLLKRQKYFTILRAPAMMPWYRHYAVHVSDLGFPGSWEQRKIKFGRCLCSRKVRVLVKEGLLFTDKNFVDKSY